METEVPGDEPRVVEAEPVHAPTVNPTQGNANARVSRYLQSASQSHQRVTLALATGRARDQWPWATVSQDVPRGDWPP